MPTISNLVVKMTGDNSSLTKAARGSVKAIKGVGKAVGTIGAIGVGAGVAAAAGLAAIGKASADNIDRLAKLATNLGVTAGEAQRLELIADLTGVGINDMAKGMQRLNKEVGLLKIGEASKLTKTALSELGLSLEQLEGLGSEEIFATVIKELGQIEDLQKRSAIGTQLLGKAFQKMNPLAEAGAGIWKNTATIFKDLGLGLGENAKNVEGLNDAWTLLTTIGTALRDQVFAELAPLIRDGVLNLVKLAGGFIKAAGGADKLAKVIRGAVAEQLKNLKQDFQAVIDVISAIGSAIGFVFDVISGVGKIGAGLVAGAAALSRGELSGAQRAITEGVEDAFGLDDDDKSEQKKHTELLKQIAKESGVAFS